MVGTPNAQDLELIRVRTDLAVDAALRGEGGVIGQDEDQTTYCARLSSRVSRAGSHSISTSHGSRSSWRASDSARCEGSALASQSTARTHASLVGRCQLRLRRSDIHRHPRETESASPRTPHYYALHPHPWRLCRQHQLVDSERRTADIGRDLGASIVQQTMVASMFTMGLASSVLYLGAIGDRAPTVLLLMGAILTIPCRCCPPPMRPPSNSSSSPGSSLDSPLV